MSKSTVTELAEKYGCDGKCYIDGCCPNIDTCPETAGGEFIGLIGALLGIVTIPILAIIALIIWL